MDATIGLLVLATIVGLVAGWTVWRARTNVAQPAPTEKEALLPSHAAPPAHASATEAIKPSILFDPEPRLRAIRAAIKNKWEVRILYIDSDGDHTDRVVTPKSERGPHMFSAFCSLRQDVRFFKYDRIEALRVRAIRKDARARYKVGDVPGED